LRVGSTSDSRIKIFGKKSQVKPLNRRQENPPLGPCQQWPYSRGMITSGHLRQALLHPKFLDRQSRNVRRIANASLPDLNYLLGDDFGYRVVSVNKTMVCNACS